MENEDNDIDNTEVLIEDFNDFVNLMNELATEITDPTDTKQVIHIGYLDCELLINRVPYRFKEIIASMDEDPAQDWTVPVVDRIKSDDSITLIPFHAELFNSGELIVESSEKVITPLFQFVQASKYRYVNGMMSICEETEGLIKIEYLNGAIFKIPINDIVTVFWSKI